MVIPVQRLGVGKSRLSAVLSSDEHSALLLRMLRHVVSVATTIDPAHVVSRDRILLSYGETPVVEVSSGLNSALQHAADMPGGTDPIPALNVDFPRRQATDLESMLASLGQADVVGATDRAGTGTNALLLARPKLIPYRFGPYSLDRHRRAAREAACRFLATYQPGLATDIDLPSDLAPAMLASGEAASMATGPRGLAKKTLHHFHTHVIGRDMLMM